MSDIDARSFRLRLGADPGDPALKREAMALGGGAQDQLRQAQAFEQALSAALAVPLPDQLQQRLAAIPAAQQSKGRPWFTRGPWLAVAASLLLLVGVASLTLQQEPSPATKRLGTISMAHLSHEPFALLRTSEVAAETIDSMLADAGLRLQRPVPVNYASRCPVDGQKTVHMVIQQPGGPVSLIYFPEANLQAVGEFSRGKTFGKTIALGPGMLVMIAEDQQSIAAVETLWREAAAGSGQQIASIW